MPHSLYNCLGLKSHEDQNLNWVGEFWNIQNVWKLLECLSIDGGKKRMGCLESVSRIFSIMQSIVYKIQSKKKIHKTRVKITAYAGAWINIHIRRKKEGGPGQNGLFGTNYGGERWFGRAMKKIRLIKKRKRSVTWSCEFLHFFDQKNIFVGGGMMTFQDRGKKVVQHQLLRGEYPLWRGHSNK